jgi:hypothetical protein
MFPSLIVAFASGSARDGSSFPSMAGVEWVGDDHRLDASIHEVFEAASFLGRLQRGRSLVRFHLEGPYFPDKLQDFASEVNS